MLNKLAAAAVLVSFALPAAAGEISPGRAMLADLLNVDAATFSLNELAQIDAEKTDAEKATRANFILEQRGNGVASAVAYDNQQENPLYPGHSANFGIAAES